MNLDALGWSDRLHDLFANLDLAGTEPARVTRADRGAATVLTAASALTARVAGQLDRSGEPGPPAVGDWVALDTRADTPVARAILPRTGALTRRRPETGGAQVLAANVDTVLVVDGLDRGPNLRRIERAAAVAWDAGATPVVVLTKADLQADLEGARAAASSAAPFSSVVVVSAASRSGLDELALHLAPGTTAVMLGPSGAGKSTLTNALLGEARQATAEVRASDRRGRHTTTARELVVLPAGGCLIDTPGIRELGLWLDPDAVEAGFADIAALARSCRFGDCRHVGEPGCAVAAAVEDGQLAADRLASYHRLIREAEASAVRRDPSRRHEVRARDRQFARLVRSVKRIKGER